MPIARDINGGTASLSGTAAPGGRKRILLVVDGVYPSTGGCEMQVRLLSRSFAAAGHDVTVLAPHLVKHMPLSDSIDGVPVERIPFPKVRRLGAIVLCMRFAMRLLSRRNQYDAVHVHTAQNLGAVAGLLRTFMRSTLMIKISGAWEFQGGILDPVLKHKPYFRFLNSCLRRADHIQCISVFTRDMLLKAGYAAPRLKMIPNAVDLNRFTPRPGTDALPVVAFVGRLVPVKAVPILLDAWAQLLPRLDAKLLIAGDGVQRAELEQQARKLGIAHRVEFCGNVTDVPKVLAQASVYVQPSYQEGMPNSVLEAMACGLPIVASRVSGNEDLVTDGENGLLVEAGDASGLANALCSLLSDPQRARQMGAQSRQIVERRFSVPAVLDMLLQAYQQAAAA